MNTNYLLDEYPLLVIPSLAVKIGLNNAIVLQQAHYWLSKSNHFHDGRKWFYKTYKDWKSELPFWSDRTIRRAISELEKEKLFITGDFNKMRADNTKWYSIDYQEFQNLVTKPCGQNDQADWSHCPSHMVNVTKAIPDITTDINDDDNEEGNSQIDQPYSNLNQSLELAVQKMEQLYLQRRGTGFFISPTDIKSIVEVVEYGVDLQDALNWTDEIFNNYKPKHPRDRINSFSYVAQYILTRYHEKIEREKALAGGGQHRAARGNTAGPCQETSGFETKNAATTGKQSQRLIGENGEIQDTECDY